MSKEFCSFCSGEVSVPPSLHWVKDETVINAMLIPSCACCCLHKAHARRMPEELPPTRPFGKDLMAKPPHTWLSGHHLCWGSTPPRPAPCPPVAALCCLLSSASQGPRSVDAPLTAGGTERGNGAFTAPAAPSPRPCRGTWKASRWGHGDGAAELPQPPAGCESPVNAAVRGTNREHRMQTALSSRVQLKVVILRKELFHPMLRKVAQDYSYSNVYSMCTQHAMSYSTPEFIYIPPNTVRFIYKTFCDVYNLYQSPFYIKTNAKSIKSL